MSKGTILVVDDDDDVREALRAVLEDEGYAVALAADGADALSYVRRRAAPQVVLLDWMMKGMDGLSCLTEIRGDRALCELKVVVLTADVKARERSQGLGVLAYLKKPVDLEDLLRAIDEVIGK